MSGGFGRGHVPLEWFFAVANSELQAAQSNLLHSLLLAI